jgi:hypothetical protein
VAVAAGSWDGAPLRCPPGISSRGLRLRFRGPGLASVRVMAVGNEVSTMSGTVAAANKILCERLPRGLDRPGSDGGSDSPKGCRHGDKEQRGLGKALPERRPLKTASPHPLARPEPADPGGGQQVRRRPTGRWNTWREAPRTPGARPETAHSSMYAASTGRICRGFVHGWVTPFSCRANLRVLSP